MCSSIANERLNMITAESKAVKLEIDQLVKVMVKVLKMIKAYSRCKVSLKLVLN